MSAETVGDEVPDEVESEETVDKDLVRDLVVQLNNVQERVDELETELQETKVTEEALRAQNKELKRVLAGSVTEWGAWNIGSMRPFHTRIKDLEETLDEHEDKFEMFVVEDGKAATPDERAMHLRQVLYNKAKRVSRQQDDPDAQLEVTMTRDECTSALGHDLARSSIIDAMKRAADGAAASNPDAVGYTPIQGSSDLQPVGGFTYSAGQAIGSAGGVEQSVLVMSVSDLTGVEARKIPTTVDGGAGGS